MIASVPAEISYGPTKTPTGSQRFTTARSLWLLSKARHAEFLSSSGALGVKNYSHEVSSAYVIWLPLKQFTPFVTAGAGALVFDPNDFQGADSQTRAAFVYGGADFN